MGNRPKSSQEFLQGHINAKQADLDAVPNPTVEPGNTKESRRANKLALSAYERKCKPIEKSISDLSKVLERQTRLFGKGAAVGN